MASGGFIPSGQYLHWMRLLSTGGYKPAARLWMDEVGRMTISDWWNYCVTPGALLEWAGSRANDGRKLRLFAVACCRRVQHLFDGSIPAETLTVAERFAEDLAKLGQLHEARENVRRMTREWGYSGSHLINALEHLTSPDPRSLMTVPFDLLYAFTNRHHPNPPWAKERMAQGNLFLDVLGEEWESSTSLDESWLESGDGRVLTMARAIYDEQRFEHVPILGDALEDAGCDDAKLLNHCREHPLHVRGCWVLDLLLGRN